MTQRSKSQEEPKEPPESKPGKTRKRGRGEGSIYKRKDGRWTAAVTLGYHNGKLKRKTVYGETRKEVQDKLTIVLRKVQEGIAISNERETLGQFLQAWLKDVVKPNVRPKTHRTYSDHVKLHIEPALGSRPIAKLTPQHIQSFLNDKLQAGLSGQSVHHLLATLRCALNVATRWGLIPRNVAALVEPPRIEKSEFQPFTPEEAQKFLAAIRGDRHESLYLVALASGLRQGEILGLRWEDIDLDSGTLVVRFALQRVNKKLRLVEPKTPKSRRVIKLPQVTITALQAHKINQEQERLAADKHWKETGLVFTTRVGTAVDARRLLTKFGKILSNAKLRHIRFHDLRHSCATLLLAQGVHPRIVMDLLGHSQISLTMNTYSHIIPAMQNEVAERMDEILTPTPAPIAVKIAVKEESQMVN